MDNGSLDQNRMRERQASRQIQGMWILGLAKDYHQVERYARQISLFSLLYNSVLVWMWNLPLQAHVFRHWVPQLVVMIRESVAPLKDRVSLEEVGLGVCSRAYFLSSFFCPFPEMWSNYFTFSLPFADMHSLPRCSISPQPGAPPNLFSTNYFLS